MGPRPPGSVGGAGADSRSLGGAEHSQSVCFEDRFEAPTPTSTPTPSRPFSRSFSTLPKT